MFFYIIIGMIVCVLILGVSFVYDVLYYTWIYLLVGVGIYYLDYLIMHLYENDSVDRKSLRIPLLLICDGIIIYAVMRYAYKYAVHGIRNWGGFLYKNHHTTFCVIVLISIILLLLGTLWFLKNVTYNIYHLIKDIRAKKKENVINRLDNIKPYAIIGACFLIVFGVNHMLVTHNRQKILIAQEPSIGRTYDDIKGMNGGFAINEPYTRYVVEIIDDQILRYSEGNYTYTKSSGWKANHIEITSEYQYEYEVYFGGRIFIIFIGNRYRVYLSDSGDIESISLEYPKIMLDK